MGGLGWSPGTASHIEAFGGEGEKWRRTRTHLSGWTSGHTRSSAFPIPHDAAGRVCWRPSGFLERVSDLYCRAHMRFFCWRLS